MAVMSVAGRAKIGDDAALAFTLSNGGATHLSFFQKCSENLQVTKLQFNLCVLGFFLKVC
jgi:hypothetical protein